MEPTQELIGVHSTGTISEAEAIKAYLNSQGILVQLRNETLGRISPLSTGPLSEVSIFVPADKVDIAKELIDVTSVDASGINKQKMATWQIISLWGISLALILGILILMFAWHF